MMGFIAPLRREPGYTTFTTLSKVVPDHVLARAIVTALVVKWALTGK